ncbi:hypothetical protein [Parvibaculum sp.]|uniref:hypothetical protein n=1 Tax=Parvibaculum sp. TaxID=2024848 RepID=UPI001D6B0A49|nr:hypothetical protein [Parvibaculum sp.]MBX3490863.1 hypothetical protein [Parvibaculum sp.]
MIGLDYGLIIQRRERRALRRRALRKALHAVNGARLIWRRFRADIATVRTMFIRPASEPSLLRLMIEDCGYDAREDRRDIYKKRRRAHQRKEARA